MTMNRVIHEAVRRDLARLEAALGSAPDGDRERAQALAAAYDNLLRQLTMHHSGEDDHVLPFVAARIPGSADVLAAMEDEHHALAVALEDTRLAVTEYAATGAAADARKARETVVRTQAVVDGHLRHEEEEFEPLLAPLLGTPEWKAVEKRLRPPLSAAGATLAWLQDGMSEQGRAHLRGAIPAPVAVLVTRLGGRSYRRIAAVWNGA
jgi:hypothetical protein